MLTDKDLKDAGITGRVIKPDDAGYDEARTVFYGGFEQRPAVIVRAADADDVTRVVTLARERGLELAVRSGGHSVAGHGLSEGGIVLDLRDLRQLDIDPAARTAWAGSGLTTGEYTSAADAYGLATGFGDTGSVGIGGITLGGGVGYLVRKHGLTIDSLLAAEVVTAGGQLLRADAESHPDLFWALRGGGGNFGVVTRFLFRLHDLGAPTGLANILGGILILPATPKVVAGFIAEAQAAPDELSTIASVMPAPPMPFIPAEVHGKMVVFGFLVYAGDGANKVGVDSGQRAVAPFRKLAAPVVDMIRPMRYPEMFPPEQPGFHPTAVSRNLFLDGFDGRTADKIFAYLGSSDAAMRVAQLRVLGGAAARVPVGATAYAHRQEPIMANVAAFYTGPQDKPAREAWVADFAAELRQGNPASYVNFVGVEGQGHVRDAYPGATYDRLREIKARYDPGNLFRVNHNIEPLVK